MTRRTVLCALVAVAATAGCNGYDAPDEAEPFDTIAPAPHDTAAVPGAGEPGSQPVP